MRQDLLSYNFQRMIVVYGNTLHVDGTVRIEFSGAWGSVDYNAIEHFERLFNSNE